MAWLKSKYNYKCPKCGMRPVDEPKTIETRPLTVEFYCPDPLCNVSKITIIFNENPSYEILGEIVTTPPNPPG